MDADDFLGGECRGREPYHCTEHLGGDYDLIDRVKRNYVNAEISDKLKSLLAIAGKVQKGGKHVTPEDVARARQRGGTDKEIHDTVLIAAAFCMFNRYVDGLATWQPRDEELYRERGKKTAKEGYVTMSREYLPAKEAVEQGA